MFISQGAWAVKIKHVANELADLQSFQILMQCFELLLVQLLLCHAALLGHLQWWDVTALSVA